MAASDTRADQVHIARSTTNFVYNTPVRTLPGVNLTQKFDLRMGAADRKGRGRGQLQAEDDGKLLSWKAPRSTKFGPGVRISADGQYLLEDGDDPNQCLKMKVTYAYLPSTPMVQPVYLQDVPNVYLSNIAASQAAAGNTVTLQYFMANSGTSLVHNVRVWIDAQTPYLSISDDNVIFVTPKTEAEALLMGILSGGANKNLWVKRTIPAGSEADGRVRAWLRASWDGV